MYLSCTNYDANVQRQILYFYVKREDLFYIFKQAIEELFETLKLLINTLFQYPSRHVVHTSLL